MRSGCSWCVWALTPSWGFDQFNRLAASGAERVAEARAALPREGLTLRCHPEAVITAEGSQAMGAEQAACGQGGWFVPVDGGYEDGVLVA
jgi:hypothetical protein